MKYLVLIILNCEAFDLCCVPTLFHCYEDHGSDGWVDNQPNKKPTVALYSKSIQI